MFKQAGNVVYREYKAMEHYRAWGYTLRDLAWLCDDHGFVLRQYPIYLRGDRPCPSVEVIEVGGWLFVRSYNTIMLSVDMRTRKVVKHCDGMSRSTLRHCQAAMKYINRRTMRSMEDDAPPECAFFQRILDKPTWENCPTHSLYELRIFGGEL